MDKLLNKKTFTHLDKTLDEKEYRNLRILCVFGGFGFDRSMIYVTEEDRVFGTGENESGCLGLGLKERFVNSPKLNTTLTNKRLVDIVCGFSFCIGLTRDGLLYSWGNNKWGQLGVDISLPMSSTPLLIGKLSDKRVVGVCCGNAHVLALTDSGQVYAWGRNSQGEVGNGSFVDTLCPTFVRFNYNVVSISCGKTHSLAVMATGLVYVWGNNKFGQLGRELKEFPNTGKLWYKYNRPVLLEAMANHVITKSVCGPNTVLLLTTKGDIYSFGLNDCGQVGNGTLDDQYIPVKVNDRIKFKDVFSSYKCHISIALSVDNQYYYWGLCKQQNILRPQLVPNSGNQSFDDIFSNSAEYKITYKAIVNINENILLDQTIRAKEDMKTYDWFECKQMESNQSKCLQNSYNSLINTNQNTNDCNVLNSQTMDSIQSSDTESNDFNNNLCEPFDRSDKNIIKFRVNDEYLYGHKEFLRLRNKKFWLKCTQVLNEENEIRVNHYSYKSFYEFIQYLYTNSVDIDCEIVVDLLSLANIYGEEVLKEKCLNFLSNSIDSTNVCQFYTKAFKQNIQELEDICFEFVAKNFRLCLCPEFQEMNESLVKNLFISSLEMTQ